MSTSIVPSESPIFGLSTLDQALNFASQMAKANLLPAHLKGSPADCLRVVMQATRWGFDPFSVADKTSVINGKLMYEGQLVSAVVNARGNLSQKLRYEFSGSGDQMVLKVVGTIAGEDAPRDITLTHAKACTINKNGQMRINPDQQMCYIGARLWARRHTPELMLGVYTPDEMDPEDPALLNVTPGQDAEPAAPERPKAPSRRGGAAAAKAAAAAEASAVDVPATPVPTATEPAAKPAEAAPVASPAAAEPAPAARETQPAKAAQPPAAAQNPEPPEIAPGVSYVGFHGKAWPCLLRAKLTAIESAQTPQGVGIIKLGVECDGYSGDVLTFECVEMQGPDGKKVPVITKPFLKVGQVIEANFRAKLRPSKEKDPNTGKALPDYKRPPALFAENITAAQNGVTEDF